MTIFRITLLGCLAAVSIAACDQDTAEPPSPDPVDSMNNEEIGEGHAGAVVTALAEVLGKPLSVDAIKDDTIKAELAMVTHLQATGWWTYYPFIAQYELDLLAACVNLVELKIEGLNLSNEQLCVLAGLTKLESLKLFGNRITDLSPIARLTNLRTLDISGNPIADLRLRPVVELPHLTALSAFGIGLTDLRPLAGLVNLQHLDLSINAIADLRPLAGLVNLQHLDLSGNAIADLRPLAGLVNLQYLDLSGNAIDDLTPLVGLVQLETLNLNNNKIVDIQPLLDNIGIGAGDEIQLKANKLSDISRNQHVPVLEARGAIVMW